MTKEILTNSLENEMDFWEQLENQEYKRKSLHKFKPSNQNERTMFELINSMNIEVPEVGKVIEAKYVGLLNDFHQFSLQGLKDDIYVENRSSENKFLKNTEIGDTLEVVITSIDPISYFVRGSVSQLHQTQAHDELLNLDDLIVTIDVRSINPAGYDVDIIYNGVTLSGFMPNTLAGINKLHDPESIVGERLQAMVENYSESEGTYIVSRRKYLKTLIPQALDNLTTGEVYMGHVTGTTPFGVFVEFNDCLTGMIHKANIVEEYRDKINDIKPGTKIEFYIKEIIKKKIILTQIMRESLWDYVKVGDILHGKVKDNKNFGTLVSLDEETMGLIHNSEIQKINKKFEKDDEIDVRVLAVDRQNRKIFLTVE
jgi:ribosomal protein S1